MDVSTSGPRPSATRSIPDWLRDRTPVADLAPDVIVWHGLESVWYDHYMARQRYLGGPA